MNEKLRQLGAVLLALTMVLSVAVVPAAAQGFQLGSSGDDPTSPTIKQHYGSPSFIINVSDDSMNSLQTWADSDADRNIVSVNNETGVATVAAPSWEVTATGWRGLLTRSTKIADEGPGVLLQDSLAALSYVESVEPNYIVSTDLPGQLLNVSEFDTPNLPLLSSEGIRSRLPGGQSFAAAGIAFDGDANRTTMADSRDILGVNDVSATGDGTTVAVIDTGANTADGQVFGNGSAGSDIRILNRSKNFVGDDPNQTVEAQGLDAVEDGTGHGTWVASSIAANTTDATTDGIAPDASLLVLKALADDGSGATADIAEAVRYAADQDADVVSMSLGSPVYSQELANAIEYAHSEGSVVAVAAGNSRQTVRWLASPADSDHALAVAATNGSMNDTAAAAYFSQVAPDPGSTDLSGGTTAGAVVDVSAPGMQTVAATPSTSGIVSNTSLSGTSMATPMVAGVLALDVEHNPTTTVDERMNWTTQSASPIPNAAEAEVGAGHANADRLVDRENSSLTQSEAMDTEAEARDEWLTAYSDAQGRTLFGILGSIGLLAAGVGLLRTREV